MPKLGADDPTDALQARLKARFLAAGGKPPKHEEMPLTLLSSPAAKRYAEAIRAAAQACQEMEQERGITDGLAEVLGDYADVAELEVYGPKGLRELE